MDVLADTLARAAYAGNSDGTNGTPTFFINGRRHYGGYDVDRMSRAVRAAGARAMFAQTGPGPGDLTRTYPGANGRTRGQCRVTHVIPHTGSRSVMSSTTMAAQIRLDRVTPSHCRVILDNPPLNLMGPEFVLQIRDIARSSRTTTE